MALPEPLKYQIHPPHTQMIHHTISLLILSAVASPQSSPDLPSLDSARALAEWRSDHGSGWKTMVTRGTGHPDFFFGGLARPAAVPTQDADFAAAALEFLTRTEEIHGMEPESLMLDRVLFLPLGQAGSTDKFTVRFHQSVDGVPVKDGAVNVLLNTQGQLLSIQSSGLPEVAGFDTTPSLAAADALRAAEVAFDTDFGLQPTSLSNPALFVVQLERNELVGPALAYEVQALWQSPDFEPEGTIYWIDAEDGSVLQRAPAIHNFDVTGTVYTMSTPGTAPDSSSNPETQMPMSYVQVSSSSGTTFTDVNGDFTITGTNDPVNVTVAYLGTFCNANNDAGGDYSLTTNASGTGNSVLLNPSSQTLVTAQANAYQAVNQLRDWVRAITPGDDTADFTVVANCNISSNCNAFYNGTSINFYTSGGGCANTAYSTVVAHEEGHWLNSRYGTGNGSDGMGEGNADVFGMYLFDDPIVGTNFCGNGCHVRNGNNNRQYCGDGNGGCYGAVHADGEVWMGAAWKVRSNLKSSNGNSSGSLIADTLFLGWMNSFNQAQIHSVIEAQWLTLDDTDGNVDNGTPHYSDIDAGFLQQGFPGYDLDLIGISDVSDLPDTDNETVAYQVDATIEAYVSPAITSADIRYRVNGGSWLTAAMAQLSGNAWSGNIPPQDSPAVVEYYVQASDTLGNSATHPEDAPASSLSFAVGVVEEILVDEFETDLGWTVGSSGDAATTGVWERGNPIGTEAQPNQDHTVVGQQCYFTEQGSVGGSLGESDVDGGYTSLVSPALDLSNHPIATVGYWRWYSNNTGASPNADIFLVELSGNNGGSWTTAEIVGPSGEETGGGWIYHELSIHEFVTPSAQTRIRFRASDLDSGSIVEAAVDDLRLVGIGPTDGCSTPVSYGDGKINSIGVAPIINGMGIPSATTNDFLINVDLGIPNQPAILFHGSEAANVPFFGGTRLVAFPVTRAGVRFLDLFGAADWDFPVNLGDVGTTRYFQIWMRDPTHSDGTGVGMSDGLQVTFCD